jgi:hypothetical protein
MCGTMREAALAILTKSERLSRKAGSFLGQCVADPAPLTNKQAEWFATLAERADVIFASGVLDD